MQTSISAKYEPRWFKKQVDEITGDEIWRFTGEYWTSKETQSFDRCPSIYMLEEENASVSEGDT